MAAAGSATNVAKELRTVFGFSFSRTASSNAGLGVTFDGCKIFHMKAGSPALKKGLKIGWVVVAVDSLAVSTESQLRAALDAWAAFGNVASAPLPAHVRCKRHTTAVWAPAGISPPPPRKLRRGV